MNIVFRYMEYMPRKKVSVTNVGSKTILVNGIHLYPLQTTFVDESIANTLVSMLGKDWLQIAQ